MDRAAFSKDRDRLLDADIVWKFFCKIREQAKKRGFCPTNTSRWTGS